MKILIISVIIILGVGCSNKSKPDTTPAPDNYRIACSTQGCQGTYSGPEFINGSDIAHQFSNSMSKEVGVHLKELYKSRHYAIVDFQNIKMTTEGMGSGTVDYSLSIPFKRVKDKCAAFTSFDHVGGWNHAPALSSRKQQLQSVLIPGESLSISALKTTPEGLEEYWIQWKHMEVQAECNSK